MRKWIKNTVKGALDKYGGFIKNYLLGTVLIICVVMLIYKTWNGLRLCYEDVITAFKASVTVLISMMSVSVSIYVFLNTALQTRRSHNIIEKEVIILFQKKKQRDLGIGLIISIIIVVAQSLIIIFNKPISSWWSIQTDINEKNICLLLIFGCVAATVFYIGWLGRFTYGIINYDEGLKQLANEEQNTEKYTSDGGHESINKGEFLNLVNNIEVIVERLIENHMHAKTSNASDSNFKRAICDGITETGELYQREIIAENYKNIINYRNLLLQDEKLKDSDNVYMGDKTKNVLNRLFQSYLKKELLTGVNISNLTINEADLSETSFHNSSFKSIVFQGRTKLCSTDFSGSILNNIKFGEADCNNINFSCAKLIDIKFDTNLNLERAFFVRADLSSMKVLGPLDKLGNNINLSYANFDEANLTHLDIYNVSFDYARMNNTKFVDSSIGKSVLKNSNVSFKYAEMKKVNFLKGDIGRCDFQNADMEKAVFTHSKVQGVNFKECILSEANFTESEISDCKFDKAYCRNISLKEARINNVSFTYATLNMADLSGTRFNKVIFSDCVCRDSLWVRTAICNSQFERCVFVGARIVGESQDRTIIELCDFSFANFTETAITNIEFKKCNFYGADFSNVRMINVRFDDCENLDKVQVFNMWLARVSYVGKNIKKLNVPSGDKWRFIDDETEAQYS